jgi:hypothetical protein
MDIITGLLGANPCLVVCKFTTVEDLKKFAATFNQLIGTPEPFNIVVDVEDIPLQSVTQNKSYQDVSELEDQRVLLLLVGKGRMGDTFPKNFRYYDLRAKHKNKTINQTSFKQEVGRAFGWASSIMARPVILLSKNALQHFLDSKESKQVKQLSNLNAKEQMNDYRRFLLRAEPQVGKTGACLHLIDLLTRKLSFCMSPPCW